MTDEYVYRKPVGWLFSQFDHVQRSRWSDWIEQVTAVESGVGRALAATFSSSKSAVRLPKLPTWDEVQNRKVEAGEHGKPSWWNKFEQANRLSSTSKNKKLSHNGR